MARRAASTRSISAPALSGPSLGRLDGLYLLVGISIAAAYVAMPERAQLIVYQLFAFSALVAVGAGLRLYRPARRVPWVLVGLYLATQVAGDSFNNVFTLGKGVAAPYPSAADVLFLCGYGCLAAAALLLAQEPSHRRNQAALLDAGVVTVSAALPIWVFLAEPQAADGSVSALERLTATAYPIMDILALAAFARLALVPGRRPPAFRMLVASIAVLLVTDGAFGLIGLQDGYTDGDPIDLGWMLAYLLAGAAVLHPSMTELPSAGEGFGSLTTRRLTVLLSAALIVPIVLAIREAGHHAAIVAASTVITLLIVLRLALESNRFDTFAAAEAQRRQLEEELRQAQKMEALGRLAGGVAHDFNNLLTAIRGYADLLADSLPRDSPLRADAEEIRRAGDRAADLTRQLLVFSRRRVESRSAVDLNALVRQAERMLRRLIGERIRLVVADAASAPLVRADPAHLEQVILNLAVNARDAMPTGGTLTIETADAALPGGVPAVRLSVAGTGHGIDPAIAGRIFEPFFTTKAADRGTGLGLSTAYSIVAEAGGTMGVDSAPGRGSRFDVLLPLTVTSAERSAPAAPGAAAPPGAARILLAEDESAVRAFAAQVLRRAGHVVLEAGNGDDALRLAFDDAIPPELVVSDVVMPGLDGPELTRRLRERGPDLPVLLMSGYTEDMLSRSDLESLGALFLEKPFTPAQLLDGVSSLLGSIAPDRLAG